MLPQNIKYPEFVSDQILTRENLDDLFKYLDEQGRITRTNLIGIGIVCGLEVKTSADGTSITISKGTGVTSEGYVVTIDDATYTDYVDYDPAKENTYDKFVMPDKTINPIYELKKQAVETSTQLTQGFLNGNGVDGNKKVVLLFVELLKLENKNCNPNSCDDKGITIEINIRPLLVNKSDIPLYQLNAGLTDATFNQGYIALDEMRIKRFDVVNTRVATSADVFNAYKNILSQSFLSSTETLLTGSWNVFKNIVGADYNNVNPFSGLAASFNFLHNGSIDSSKVIFMQYYYDYFSDLLAAYDEFRITGMEVLSTCCPDSTLFPRHLLLDLAIKDASINYSQYRHYFIYSPLFQQRDLLGKLKMLFRRLALMRTNFSVPAVAGANTTLDAYQRITPSRLDHSAISNKAIPYYYTVNSGANPLFKNWSFEKSRVNAADKNLSYHAAQYTGKDYITNALKYDLEPYNFLRVEGIIGKQYTHVLRNIKRQIQDNRLPFDIIAVCTDDNEYTASRASHNSTSLNRLAAMTREGLGDIRCHFRDLETIYDSIKNEMLCTLCKELRYYYEIPVALGAFNKRVVGAKAAATVDQGDFSESEVDLFEHCTKVPYRIKENTFGVIIERIYRHVGLDSEITINEILEALGLDPTTDSDGDGTPDNTFDSNLVLAIMLMMPILEIPIYIIRLANYFTDDLHGFDVAGYCKLQERIAQKIKGYKSGAALVSNNDRTAIKKSVEEDVNTEAKIAADAIKKESEDVKIALANNAESQPAAGAAAPPPPPSTEPVETNNTRNVNTLASLQSGLAYFVLYMLILEDLYDHLDVLAYNCKCRALMGVKEEYLRRVTELAELRQLQNFSRKHPGLQHKAGVPMGGTFIIVYHHPAQKRRKAAEKEAVVIGKKEMAGFKKLSDKKEFGEEVSDEILKLVAILKKKKISVLEFVRYVEKIGEEVDDVIEIIREIDPDLLRNIKGLKIEDIRDTEEEDAITEAANDLQEGIVIADFYVPYLCYSNCPPVIYQVGEIKDVPVNVTLGLQPNPKTNANIYSINDDTPYLFTSSPEGGSINNGTEANGVFKDGEKYVFVPYKLKELIGANEKIELSFSYTAQGNVSNTVNVTVYNAPSAAIQLDPHKMPQSIGSVIKISSITQFADKYLWMIDGKEVSTDQHIGEKTFNEATIYKVSLSVIQSQTGETAVAQDVAIVIAGKPTVYIEGEPVSEVPNKLDTFKIDSFKAINISKEFTLPKLADSEIVIPLGGKVNFTSHSENAVSFEWIINNEKVSTEEHLNEFVFKKALTHSVKQVVTSITGETEESNIIKVIVEEKPSATIITDLKILPGVISVNTGVIFNSSSKNADKWHWTIRNSETGFVVEESSNEHLGSFIFDKAGEYKIDLFVAQSSTGATGNATAVSITVVESPSAKIVTDPIVIPSIVQAGTTITFNGESKNADEYLWTLNDATGAVLKTAKTEHFGNIDFPNEGTFVVSYKVGNSTTKTTADATDVVVLVQKSEKEPFIIYIDPPTKETIFLNSATLSITTDYSATKTFRWKINGTTVAGITGNNLSDRTYTTGVYNIQAEAIQPSSGQVIAVSNTITFIVKDEKDPTEPTKNFCGSLPAIIENFNNLGALDKANFQQFFGVVLLELGLSEYFSMMEERIANESPEIQLDFFENEIFRGALIDKNLEGWFFALLSILSDEKRQNLHLLSAALYRILVQLTMYISCIHKQDIVPNLLNMANVLRVIRETIEQLLINIKQLSPLAQDQIIEIGSLIRKQLDMMDANGIDKPFYRSLLNEILELF